MATTRQAPEATVDYIIAACTINNSRLKQPIDVRNQIIQLDMYESMERPYITANLVILDDTRLYDIVGFDGTETVTIRLLQPLATHSETIKTFIIERIMDSQKISDQGETLVLKLVEQTAFNDAINKFSKAYTGRPDIIIAKVLRDQLGLEIDNPLTTPVQSEMKLVVPYLTPFQACEWVLNRMSTTDGFPYFLYATLNDDNIQLKSLEDLLLAPSWNADIPFRYSQAYSHSTATATSEELLYNINGFEQTGVENTMDYVIGGAVGSDFNIHDIVSGQTERFHFNLENVIGMLETKGIISVDQEPTFNLDYALNDRSIELHSSKRVTRIVMNNSYNNDIPNYYQENTVDKFRLDAVSSILKYILFKSSVNMSINGLHFLDGSNKTLGRNIDVFYLNNDPDHGFEPTPSQLSLKDYKRSGKYMIYAAKHTFFETQHTVNVTGVKLANDRVITS